MLNTRVCSPKTGNAAFTRAPLCMNNWLIVGSGLERVSWMNVFAAIEIIFQMLSECRSGGSD